MQTLRLVDVRDNLIFEAHNLRLADFDFVALSYTWGTTETAKLVKANRSVLQQPASLSRLLLPRTIIDSMELVRMLGLRYLWVDALCIVQDDLDDKSYQIEKMATIYMSAFLSIQAAAGKDSNTGLPGLGSSMRLYNQREVVVEPPSEASTGLSVVNTMRSYPAEWDEWFTRGKEDADFSRWSQRAWTMQEKFLSRRTLLFTQEQVFWSCQQAYYCEESHFEVPKTRVTHYNPSIHKLNALGLEKGDSGSWELYGNLIENYTRRDLTYAGDILAAFQAILDVMQKATKSGFLWALPHSRFELGLSWQTFHGVHRRTAPSTLPMTSLKKHVHFPSWSWLGWVGDVHFKVGNLRRERYPILVILLL